MLLVSMSRRAAFVEGMSTMASVAVKNLPLDEQFPPDAIGRCHEARNIPCFNVLIQKEDNAPLESVKLPNHFFHLTEPSEVQSKLPIRDELAQLYCYKELLGSTLGP